MINSILIVCIGNICRSPMAEYLLRHKLQLRHSDAPLSHSGAGRNPSTGGPQSHSAPPRHSGGFWRDPPRAGGDRNPPGLRIESAGIGALVDKPAAQTTLDLLAEQGIDATAHRARQIDVSMLNSTDLVLAMEQQHLEHLYKLAPQIRGRAFLLCKWSGNQQVPDPYRQQRPAFEHVYRLVDQATSAWLPYLA